MAPKTTASAPADANYSLSIGRAQYGSPEPTIHILGCSEQESRALGHELVATLLRMPIFKSRDPSGRSLGVLHVNSYSVTVEIVDRTEVGAIMKALTEAIIARSGRPPSAPKLDRVKPGEVPRPGQHIYVQSAFYLDHGQDDFRGGIATVKAVKPQMSAGKEVPFVEIHERPGAQYNWRLLEEEQPKLEREYGLQWSHPDPDV